MKLGVHGLSCAIIQFILIYYLWIIYSNIKLFVFITSPLIYLHLSKFNQYGTLLCCYTTHNA
ncbi:hypothetical protein Lalb_Chr03g0035611 [Lupinus albus]|uniref:Uncharacterized protein n=1 Tax=Lupinus albus TaxID=3870 RepID=A0A6A4QUE5_LUPAL|nr:hypothetical protein Lalb_Chr03g0035611 [Lupinus albus]